MNRDNIRKTIELMRAHPEQFDMSLVHCGTSACIAGFACAAKLEKDRIPEAKIEEYIFTTDEAREFLGLHEGTAHRLFFPSSNRYYRASSEQGIKVLEHLLETGKVDWSVSGIEDYPKEFAI